MIGALSQRVKDRVSPVEKPTPPPTAKPVKRPEPALSIPTPQPSPLTQPRPSRVREKDWAGDFIRPTTLPHQARAPSDWWNDFNPTQATTEERLITSNADWKEDFRAQEGKLSPVTPSYKIEIPTENNWEQDFAAKKPDEADPESSDPNWKGDFKV
jgi:hypothetical protein